jgi:hypothetical protein
MHVLMINRVRVCVRGAVYQAPCMITFTMYDCTMYTFPPSIKTKKETSVIDCVCMQAGCESAAVFSPIFCHPLHEIFCDLLSFALSLNFLQFNTFIKLLV